ncbi:TIGR03862 family flavoprotein [Comamonas flocculans]|nr:TIGR03862 family flavoprotein [Comamonas flocculans]
MAAEVLSRAGVAVDVFDAMPSAGRKFLLAGKGGLNLTHSEPLAPFTGRFRQGDGVGAADAVASWLRDFGPEAVRGWAAGLGVQTFVGSSGRVFPTEMKAAPLLRAWLLRLRQPDAPGAAPVRFHMRHRWAGWAADTSDSIAAGACPASAGGVFCFETPAGAVAVRPRAAVLALGGGSWPRLGSDGAWAPWLAQAGAEVAPLVPANCGFDVGWSAHLAERFAGVPLKNVVLSFVDGQGRRFERRGECVLTATGMEGSLVYAASSLLRDEIAAHGHATLHLNLQPDRTRAQVLAAVAHPRGSRSLSSHLKSRLGLQAVHLALLHECIDSEALRDPLRLAAALQTLPVTLRAPRPVAQAISSGGGVRFASLTDDLQLRGMPGVFCAGEMLDWEAPTGGYLLTACLASGVRAAQGVLRHLRGGEQAGGPSMPPGHAGGL